MTEAPTTGRARLRTWSRAVLRGDASMPTWLAAGVVASILVLSWFATYALGGAGRVAPHWFYLAILSAAARFGFPGAWVTGALAGILAGPLLPLDVDTGTVQAASDWLSRGAFFLGIGTVMAWLVRRLQDALRRELDVLEQERELAERSAAVIQSVGHEFRTPLTVLSGSLKVLRSKTMNPEEKANFVDGMSTAVERMGGLVDVVAATSEALYGDVASHEVIDVPTLCQEIAADLGRLDGDERISISHHTALVVGDRRLLRVALRAVIENALKFSGPRTPVAVTTTIHDDTVQVSVRDHGPGIAPEIVDRGLDAPFSPRRSTATSGGGLGLGLFSANQALRRSGATIEFRRPDDGGTTVVMRLPAAGRRARTPGVSTPIR